MYAKFSNKELQTYSNILIKRHYDHALKCPIKSKLDFFIVKN